MNTSNIDLFKIHNSYSKCILPLNQQNCDKQTNKQTNKQIKITPYFMLSQYIYTLEDSHVVL